MMLVRDRELQLRDRLLAPIAVRDGGGKVVGANFGALVRRLVLFEQVVIDSYGMRELPLLIDAIGPDSFIALLESGAVRIRGDGWTYGETGDGGLVPGYGPEPLPPMHYSLAPLVPAQEFRKEHISRHMEQIRRMPLGIKTSKRVRRAIVAALVEFPEAAGTKSMETLPRDLTGNLNLVRAATATVLEETLGQRPDESAFEIRVEQVDEHVFAAITDIRERFGLGETAADKVVQDALLGIAGIHQRLEEIEAYKAIVGFREAELHLAQEKFAFLLTEQDADVQEARFQRVISLGELPDPETVEGAVNVDRLIEIRDSEEIREFRQWLRTVDEVSDEELRERLKSVRAKLAAAVNTPTGKAVKFLASSGLGLMTAGAASVGLQALDQFVLERVLGEPGPVSFIGSTYPSIFKRA